MESKETERKTYDRNGFSVIEVKSGKSYKFAFRPIEQIINEGKAMLAAKDEQIKIFVENTKSIIDYEKEQFKTIGDLLSKNHILKLEGIKKDIDMSMLKDNCNTYVSKIQEQNDRIAKLRSTVDNYANDYLDMSKELQKAKYMFTGAFLACVVFFITIIVMLCIYE